MPWIELTDAKLGKVHVNMNMVLRVTEGVGGAFLQCSPEPNHGLSVTETVDEVMNRLEVELKRLAALEG